MNPIAKLNALHQEISSRSDLDQLTLTGLLLDFVPESELLDWLYNCDQAGILWDCYRGKHIAKPLRQIRSLERPQLPATILEPTAELCRYLVGQSKYLDQSRLAKLCSALGDEDISIPQVAMAYQTAVGRPLTQTQPVTTGMTPIRRAHISPQLKQSSKIVRKRSRPIRDWLYKVVDRFVSWVEDLADEAQEVWREPSRRPQYYQEPKSINWSVILIAIALVAAILILGVFVLYIYLVAGLILLAFALGGD